jgi:GT2 family glycosyltransferase
VSENKSDRAADAAIEVFIPTLAGRKHLPRTLEALGAGWRARCTVIDNASVDGTRDVLAGFPELHTLRHERNLGFGAAINVAVERSRAAVIVVMNDDVVPRPGAIDALGEALEAEPGIGMAAGVLVDGQGRIDSAGLACDPSLASHDVLRGRLPDRLPTSDRSLVGPCGGFAAYRRAAFDEVGGFDPGFFAYYEDLDLALRLRRRGWGCQLAATALADHVGSATVGWRSEWKAELVGFSRGRMLSKYAALRRPGALPWLALEAAGSLVLAAELGSARPLTARIRGYRSCTQREPYPQRAQILERSFAAAAGQRLRRRYARAG